MRSSVSSKPTAPVRDRVVPDKATSPVDDEAFFPTLIKKTSSAPVLAVESRDVQVFYLLIAFNLGDHGDLVVYFN